MHTVSTSTWPYKSFTLHQVGGGCSFSILDYLYFINKYMYNYYTVCFTKMKLEGSVAIVFGAAQGIGLAYTEVLLERNVSVCMTDILEKEGREVEKTLQQKYSGKKLFFEVCDICKEESIRDAFDKTSKLLGTVNIVVNNCGIINEFDWRKCLDINLGGNISCFNVTRERLGKENGGHGAVYVATSSISGLRPEYWGPVYSASKHAVVAYLRSWAHEKNYSNHGIRLNAICPTRVATPFLQQVRADRMLHAAEHLEDKNQADNTFTPGEVAKALIMLLEDDTRNGQALRVTKENGYDFASFLDQPLQ